MKRYHVIGVSFLAGLVVGALLCGSAHAEMRTLYIKDVNGKTLSAGSISTAQGERSMTLIQTSHKKAKEFTTVSEGHSVNVRGGSAWVTDWKEVGGDGWLMRTFELNSDNTISICMAENKSTEWVCAEGWKE